MKTSVAVVVVLLTVLPTFGQYSARRLTRRVTQPPPQQPAATTPAPAPAPAQPQPTYRPPVATTPAPSAPVDPQKVAAQKSKSEKDLLAWQKKRAEEGSDNAQYELGVRYLTGNGVDQDEKLGKEWLEKAAKNGNPKATKKLEELSAGGGANLPGTPVITAPAPTPAPASTPSK